MLFKFIFQIFLLTIFQKDINSQQTKSYLSLTNYNKSVKPDGHTDLNITFYLKEIISLDESLNTITTNVVLVLEWIDHRLKWNSFSSNSILIKSNKIWLPKLMVLNSVQSFQFLEVSKNNYAVAHSDGLIKLVIKIPLLKTRCSINFLKFPYDEQNCEIHIIS